MLNLNIAQESQHRLIEKAYPLVQLEANRFRDLPPGITAEDLVSLGGEALIGAAAVYEPAQNPNWLGFARLYLRNEFTAYIRSVRRQSARSSPLEIEHQDGSTSPRPDARTADPVDLASTRESIKPRGRTSARSLAEVLPSPAVVATQVSRLRESMFGSIREADIAAMMDGLMQKAKNGDLRAVRIVIDMLGSRTSGITVNQQAIVVHPGDVS